MARQSSAMPRVAGMILAVAATVLTACGDSEQGASAASGGPPAMPVSIIEAKAEAIPIVNELPGRIAPVRNAEVRPQVSGIVVERVFEQGSMVTEGDLLYVIDPEPFQVQVQRAEATLSRAEAAYLQARQQADRQKALRERQVASAQTLDDAVARMAEANADVAFSRAELAAARLNLQYSAMTAPISGRIGRAQVTEGALVVANTGEPLAVIQQIDPVYADFTQSATQLMRLRRDVETGVVASAGPGAARVHLLFDDGTPYAHAGRLLFSESIVDPMTGQITLRGEFPNPDGDLLPGMYIRVRIEQGIQTAALAVPQQAVQRDQGGGAQLYIVGADDTVELRPVTAGRTVGENWVIDQGLNPGDRVVVEGFQKIRPGATVRPQPWPGTDAVGPDGSGNPTSAAPTAGAG